MPNAEAFDVAVIGAGAAGMMCAIEAGRRGRRVLVIDHARAPGEKIRISGGGRCNFTNLGAAPRHFLSQNPAFCIGPLARYTPRDFLDLIERHGIAWHEKAQGQLFCDGSARQVVEMLAAEMRQAGVTLRLEASAEGIARTAEGFSFESQGRTVSCPSLVLATGGKSIPKMGATGFAYEVARQFGLAVTETRPALVPVTFETGLLEGLKPLAGVAVDAAVACGPGRFEDALLFTHRGLSGPAILQISSYWREGQALEIDLAPGFDARATLRAAKATHGRQPAASVLSERLPKRLALHLAEQSGAAGRLGDLGGPALEALAGAVNAWRVKPVGSEGYRTAEVTLGGVDTAGLDGRTMQTRAVPGLFVVGEAVDVTGWLGGYNFQWAWASGWCAGQAV